MLLIFSLLVGELYIYRDGTGNVRADLGRV